MDLQLTSINRDAIYFDGYLPETKLSERMKRGVKASVDSAQHRSMLADGYRRRVPPTSHEDELPFFLVPGKHTHSRTRSLTPVFLVPIVLDALRSSAAYRYLVHVVPGEADSFCADQLKSHGGVVLTSDSDLLVHDVGNGRVAFFREIRENEDENAEDPDSWIFLFFDVSDILKRTELSPDVDARRLGFEVWRNSGASFNAIKVFSQRDLPSETHRQEFEEFCQQYETPELPVPQTARGNKLWLSGLDPRVSEYVVQMGTHEADSDNDRGAVRVFLPAVSEDANRGSPWTPSTPIRQLAYTIFSWIIPDAHPRPDVREFRRIQTIQQKGSPMSILNNATAKSLIKVILDYIQSLKALLGHTGNLFWTLLCLAMDVRDCLEYEKLPYVLVVLRASANYMSHDKMDKIHWDVAHFTGHLQACFYSFRMLHQILNIIPKEELENMPTEVSQLWDAVIDMPGVDEFPDCESSLEFLETCKETKPLEIINGLVEMPSWVTSPASNEKEPKKRKKRSKSSEQQPGKRRPANPFSVLEDE